MLIGEVSRRSGVSAPMLRHYDALGLVTPTGRTAAGYREYTRDDIRRLFHVESLRGLGLSLSEVRRALDDTEFVPADLVADLVRHTQDRIAAETELLARLEKVGASSPASWDDVLRVVELLRAIESHSGSRRQQALLAGHDENTVPAAALAEAVLAEEDPNVAGALCWSLARANGQGLSVLAEGLESADTGVRRRAVLAVAEIGAPETTSLLVRALEDADTAVRDRAALALGHRGVGDAVPVLVAMVVEGRADVEAAELLGRQSVRSEASIDVVDALRAELAGSTDPAARLRITQALAEIPGPAARDVLVVLAGDEDRTIASTAAVVLDRRSP